MNKYLGLGLMGLGIGMVFYGLKGLANAVEKQSADLDKVIKESDRMCKEVRETLKKYATFEEELKEVK